MQSKDYHIVYFLGIGGIGMSALARWFIRQGKRVAGYDRTATALTRELESEGMEIHYDDRIEQIPGYVLDNKETTLVIVTPAVPVNHTELNFLRAQGYTIKKRAEVLGLISRSHRTLAVAGTHGKTTTSSMIAHILKSASKDMVAFLGGVSANYGSNLVCQGLADESALMVAEADEFDRSFLQLHPWLAVVTSADADHLDIYGNHQAMLDAYRKFIAQVQQHLIVHEKVASLADDITHIQKYTYGMNRGQFFAEHVRPAKQAGFFEFNLHGLDAVHPVSLGVPGFHNVENAVAAAATCYLAGVPGNVIARALATFKGVKRRFEFILQTPDVVFIDDYAHHPAEIEAFLRSVKAMYPQRKLTVVFQPHLYTRTRDFADGFAQSLSLADELVLLDIYPAREQPIPGVDTSLIFEKVTTRKELSTKADLPGLLKSKKIEVLATVGAGDIDTLVEPIKKQLQ
ncbi:MAG: UDP-N-acetylmuramate--L-alanine ligase [Cyclobacteriaceae bacterium]|nr:MAG: UDP-N-acetylmuramate--L-alanine ligase [Cyclobacteriaceae bacterium]